MKNIIIKIISLSIIFTMFEMIELHISPLLKNNLATYQMSYTFESNLFIQIYSYISNYSWTIYLLLTILVFYKEILKLYKKIKKTKEN